MQNNAIKFTSYQRQIMQDTQFLLEKREVIQKVEEIWAQLQQNLAQPGTYISTAENALGLKFDDAKITRGENYLGLPYVVLDYPRYFNKQDIFCFRSMFWWGNFYSFTVYALGDPLKSIRQNIHFSKLLNLENTYIGIGKNAWQYEFTADNYALIPDLETEKLKQILLTQPFIKISRKIPVSVPENEIITEAEASLKLILNALFN